MPDLLPSLPDGYSTVPAGKLANAVTCLEMRERQPRHMSAPLPGLCVERMLADPVSYRQLYRAVGEEWMWVSRLTMSDDALSAVLNHPLVECYVLHDGTQRLGLLELDFRQQGECEIVYFGLVADAIGKGAGRFFMDHALAVAWRHSVDRVWLHTCHFDSPSALPFYRRSGFKPFAFMVEVIDDPRLSGVLPRTAAPHIPLIE